MTEFSTENIFVKSENFSVNIKNNSEIIKNIFVRTVQNVISDRLKVCFGRSEKDFGRSETKLFSLITRILLVITNVFRDISRNITVHSTVFISINTVFFELKIQNYFVKADRSGNYKCIPCNVFILQELNIRKILTEQAEVRGLITYCIIYIFRINGYAGYLM